MNIHGEGGADISDLLFYNAATGRAYYSVGLRPGVTDIANTGGFQPFMGFQAAPGFTSIVPMNINGDALTDLLWYNSATGLALYTVGVWHKPFVDSNGVAHLAYYSQDLVSVQDAAPGWTSIVPMRMNNDPLTDLLSYNAATGLAVYSIGNGISQTIINSVNAAPGWTSIVPFDLNGDGLTDLLSYNAATGLAFYSIATGPGVQEVVGPAAQGAAGWTSIVPMKLTPDPKGVTRGMTDLLFYK